MSAAPQPETTKVCKGCQRELPLTEEYYRPVPAKGYVGSGWRGTCRRCGHEAEGKRALVARAALRDQEAAKPAGKWAPRVVGAEGPEGGFTEHPVEGVKFVNLPDAHGIRCDWRAISGACAFLRYYQPALVTLLGDNIDFEGMSRFDKPAESMFSLGEDIEACQKFLRLVRESAPNARILYLKGNHEARFQKYLWKHPEIAAILKFKNTDLPKIIEVADHGVEWLDTGHFQATDELLFKHGNSVRSRSAYSAMAELEKNGLSGASGHTHRLGMHYKTDRRGMRVWAESGCLCDLNPPYAEGQTMDWQHGLSFGSFSTKGGSFTLHTAPIIEGRVKALGKDIGE